jgi:hypothetical protein
MPAGRPCLYKPEYAEQARKLCELGATDADLADFFSVTTVTIWRWAGKFPEFCNALKTGKDVADERVERSLYHRAVGYTYDAVKIFMPSGADAPVYAPYQEHVPPDATSALFWLKNRRPDAWRDKSEQVIRHEHVIEMTDDELARIAAAGSAGATPKARNPKQLN